MPRSRKDTNRNAFIGAPGTDTAAAGGDHDGLAGVPSLPAHASRHEAAFTSLYVILGRDDGWLRVVPHEHGQVSYWKWKFTRGPWRNHYVMVRMDKMDFAEPMWLLEQKLLQVDMGERRPSLDHPYGDDDA